LGFFWLSTKISHQNETNGVALAMGFAEADGRIGRKEKARWEVLPAASRSFALKQRIVFHNRSYRLDIITPDWHRRPNRFLKKNKRTHRQNQIPDLRRHSRSPSSTPAGTQRVPPAELLPSPIPSPPVDLAVFSVLAQSCCSRSTGSLILPPTVRPSRPRRLSSSSA
jgi:hypothetical protein